MRENVTIGDIREFCVKGGNKIVGVLVENNYAMATLKIAGSEGIKEIGFDEVVEVNSASISSVQRDSLEKIYKYMRAHKKYAEKKNELEAKMRQLEGAVNNHMNRFRMDDMEYSDGDFVITLFRLMNKETRGELGLKGYGVKFKRTDSESLKIWIFRNKPLGEDVIAYMGQLKNSATKESKENMERAVNILSEDNFKYYARHGVTGVSVKEDSKIDGYVYKHLIVIDLKDSKLNRQLLKSVVNGLLMVRK